MQEAAEAECHCALDGILAQDVRESLAVSRRSLLPLFGLVFPLVDSCGESSFHVTQRIDHRFQVDSRTLYLCKRMEIAGFLTPRHVQVVEEIVDGSIYCVGF